MAPPAKKRRTTRSTRAEPDPDVEQASEPVTEENANQEISEDVHSQTEDAPAEAAPVADELGTGESTAEDEKPSADDKPAADDAPRAIATADADAGAGGATKPNDRMARFKALQARAKNSSETNLKEATLESQRLATDPSQLTALHRRHAIASHKLLKADVEEAGDDFERKRAWDWTVDESERWDRRMKKKAAHRDNNAFQDYAQESSKVYKRQRQNIGPDMERYERDKMAAIEKSAASGGLDIVELEGGELVAVDKDGSFYSTADSTSFTQNKPDKAAVDRLVADMKRAEEQTLKKRRDRMAKNGDDGDVTYINEKNKQFNQKLGRFYDKYTAEIRDSFERGTMI